MLAFTAVFLIICACSNKRAVELNDIIDRQEKQSFNMLLGEKGLESQKLNHLIARHYDRALAVIDQQEAEFNRIIKSVEKINTDGISNGKEVQQTSVNYYTSLKNLYLFSRQEIQQEKLSRSTNNKEADAAQRKLADLYREKQQLYQKVYQSEDEFYRTLKIFQEENKLK